ncbi:MAG: Asp-tRNA(Asn)/Glu-tRNA(Gln) amidotransferase subunit GatA, partial [Leptonema sp. (in: Bacteria)]|nr:Asp-tRNA(Asn)/Glu-tRNA(Gln) amidotransferase subunit GatA [Leptonema sp. (in: bacteria)]
MNQFQPKGILNRSATEHLAALSKGEYSALELTQESIKHAKATKELNIFLSIDEERILNQAKNSDSRRQSGRIGKLEGIPVSVKDNIAEEGEQLTCASKFLENYRSPYSATVIQKLKDEGAVLFGRTNLDEFAMGSSTENSAFGVTKNPHSTDRVPGGSSGGSAASVAAGIVPLSIGTDTGGSIRQPAAYCGVYGLKPTYGQVSRYGAVAFASSLDQIGPFARTTDDTALLMSVLEGHDPLDSTSYFESPKTDTEIKTLSSQQLKKLKVGVQIPDINEPGFDTSVVEACQTLIEKLKSLGTQIIPIHSKLWQYSIPLYYILATAEASSNLARFDGIRYGVRSKNSKGLIDLYVRSRTEGFGPEVKRRILLGTYVLSSG